ncbi:uncharacterized protein LOC144135513 [Amblyomma americanum]
MRIVCVLLSLLVAIAAENRAPLPMPSYACKTAKAFDVPESAFHMYEALAWELTRVLSIKRRPIFYMLGIRRIRWPKKRKNIVILDLATADSICKTWPKTFAKGNCRPRRNSDIYTCTGWALVRDGLQLRRFVKLFCKRSPRNP